MKYEKIIEWYRVWKLLRRLILLISPITFQVDELFLRWLSDPDNQDLLQSKLRLIQAGEPITACQNRHSRSSSSHHHHRDRGDGPGAPSPSSSSSSLRSPRPTSPSTPPCSPTPNKTTASSPRSPRVPGSGSGLGGASKPSWRSKVSQSCCFFSLFYKDLIK